MNESIPSRVWLDSLTLPFDPVPNAIRETFNPDLPSATLSTVTSRLRSKSIDPGLIVVNPAILASPLRKKWRRDSSFIFSDVYYSTDVYYSKYTKQNESRFTFRVFFCNLSL